MTPTIQDLGLDRLSPEERLDIAEAIWDSVSCDMQSATLPESQRKELERRIKLNHEALSEMQAARQIFLSE